MAKSQGKQGTSGSPYSPRPTRQEDTDVTPHEAVLIRLQSWAPSAKAQSEMLSLSCWEKEQPDGKTKHRSLGMSPNVILWSVPGNAPHLWDIQDEVPPALVLPSLHRLLKCPSVAIADPDLERLKSPKIHYWALGAQKIFKGQARFTSRHMAGKHLLLQLDVVLETEN